MKNLFKILILFLFITSCGDTNTNPNHEISYYKNGNIKEESQSFWDDKGEFIGSRTTRYSQNGNKSSFFSISKIDGIQISINYYENGNIKTESKTSQMGGEFYDFKTYYQNGELKSHIQTHTTTNGKKTILKNELY
tara:strand:- start:1182 stop:1589 length:408 start_codon:yes stop_codon:yes gene_type:complete